MRSCMHAYKYTLAMVSEKNCAFTYTQPLSLYLFLSIKLSVGRLRFIEEMSGLLNIVNREEFSSVETICSKNNFSSYPGTTKFSAF